MLDPVGPCPGPCSGPGCVNCERAPVAPRAGDDTTNPKDLIGRTKVPLRLNPFPALIHMAHAFWDGARKYGPFNWRKKRVSASVYIDAALRHVADFMDGQDVADDSGAHHLGHAMACFAIILDAKECGSLIDDRPAPGVSARLLEEIRLKIEARSKALQST